MGRPKRLPQIGTPGERDRRASKGCPRMDKRAHYSRQDAWRVLNKTGRHNAAFPYQCRCGYWHTGTPRRPLERLQAGKVVK